MSFNGSNRLIAKSVIDASLSVEAPKYRLDTRICCPPKSRFADFWGVVPWAYLR